MNKKIILFLCLFTILLSVSCVAAENSTTTVDSKVITVDGSSQNQMNEPTIQTAIDSAESGDTINITGKNYAHCHFVVDKNLTIISNVGTTMEACSGYTQGSGGLGIFYFTSRATGSYLSGFTFTNYHAKSVVSTTDPYGIYVNGASDITISNCRVNEVSYGPGIYLKNTTDITVENSVVKNSNKGIYIENSNNTKIINSDIEKNNDAGIWIGKNVYGFLIDNNTITNNLIKGIYMASAYYSNITNNLITNNKKTSDGCGIYINSSVVKVRIIGNLVHTNGKYGIFNSGEAMGSLVNQSVELIDENIFYGHGTRAVYAEDNYGCSATIYVGSNFYGSDLMCPSTAYEPGFLVVANNNPRDLILSEITEVSTGVYSVSVIRKNTKEVAVDLSKGNITFFLNKNGTVAKILDGDIAVTSPIINGRAIANLSDARFKSSGNVITASGPGEGSIDFRPVSSRLCAKYEIPDENLPNATAIKAVLTAANIVNYYGAGATYRVKLVDDDGNPITGERVNIILNGNLYQKTTNSKGESSLRINLNSGKYNIVASYCGSKVYDCDNSLNTITILPTVGSNDLTKTYRNSTQYEATFYDSEGNKITKTNVTFNINGIMYTKLTNDKGIAKLNINLNPNKYTITAINPITNEQISNTIVVLSTITQNTNITKYYKNSTQYIVRLMDSKGNPEKSGVEVKFNINGIIYTKTTNSEGYAKLNINLQPSTYIITAEYRNCKVSNTIKILPVLTANDLVKAQGTAPQFQVKLVDGNGNPLKGATIDFNINGIHYAKTTSINGQASLSINLQAGKYIITSSYNGSNIANHITIT